jgi:nitronate monooxygenase
MTTFRQLLGIELPIIQAPMAGVQGSDLAIAVAKAESQGDGGFSPLWCGQNALGYSELPAAGVTRALAGV